MKRKKYFSKRILSFLLTFVLLFSQSGMFAFAEGSEFPNDVQTESDENTETEEGIVPDSEEGPDEEVGEEELSEGSLQSGEWVKITSDGQVIDTITVNGVTVEAKYVTLATRNKINVGTDTTYSCAAFVKRFYSAVYGADVYNLLGPSYTPKDTKGGTFSQVSSPQVGDIVRDNEGTHWAIVKSVQSDGKVILIQQNRHWEKGDGYTYGDKNGSVGSRSVTYFRYSGSGNGGGQTTSYVVTNTGVTDITSSTARINATVSPTAYVTELGFYLGTSTGNMQKHVESFSGNVISIWYDLGTGKWTGALSQGTTYYYKIYIVCGGVTYYSAIDSFVTPNPASNTVIVDAGVSNLTRTSATITATLPEMKYCTEDGFFLGTNPNSMAKKSEAGGGNTLKVWFDLGTGKWTDALQKGTTYYYQLYVVTGGVTYTTSINSFTTPGDNINPNIKSVQVTNLSPLGYTIVCEATDNVGIERVICPTWTDANGQDDLKGDYFNNTKATLISGNTYSYNVKISDHNNESGKYISDVYAYDGDGNYTCVRISVVVPVYVSSITLSSTTKEMIAGDKAVLTATIAPSNATNKAVLWSSSNEGVVSVDQSGNITAISAGTAVITVTAQDAGGVSARCTVTVKASSTPVQTDYATVTVGSASAKAGSNIEIPISISKNPGIAGAAFSIKYDKTALTLSEIKAGAVFSSGTFTSSNDKGLIQWYYAGESSIKTNGVLFTATFTVNASAKKGDYIVSVGLLNDEKANFTDHNATEVPVVFNAGKITVGDCVKGDLTGDGVVAMGDVVKVARAVAGYITLTEEEEIAADVTGDTKVAMGDVVKIARYVAGYIDSLDVTAATTSSVYNDIVDQHNTIMSDIPGKEGQIDFASEAEMIVSGNKAKAGETVEIPVVLKTNPGIASAALTVSYDSASLELTSITKGEVFSGGTFNGDTEKNLIQWYDVSGNKDTTATGTAFTLGFKVKSGTTAGSYTVKVGYLDNDEANVTNINSENVKVSFTDGVIKVEGGNGEQPDAKTAVMEVGSGKAEAGKSIDIPVKITTNPGIASAALTVSYNTTVLSLKTITKGEVFNNGTFTGDIDKNLIQWYDVAENKDTTATGEMFTLTFEVKDSATEGKYAVELGYLNDEETNVTNINSENVKVSFTAGEIEVEKTGQEEPDTKNAVVEVGKGKTISGNSISIPVKMTSNPGIASVALSISYDATALTLNSITQGDVFSSGTFNADIEKNLVQWYDVSGNKDTTKTGVMFTLKFDVKESASAGKYAIKVGYLNDNESNVTNINSENVAVTFKDGEVEVVSGSVMPGVAKEDPMCVAPDVTEETTDLYLIKGQKFTMPETGWISSNKKFVSVSKKGVVKAKKVTTAPITLTNGERTINVYVTLPVIDKKLEIKSTDETNEYKIKLDYDSEHLDVYWCSNAPDVATVDDEGVVEGVAAGSATITAYINGKAFKCKVKVKETEPYAERTVHMTVGASKTVKIKGLKNPVWESDDTSIVTVNKNKITAVAKGMACLTTTAGEKKYYVYVRVEDLTLDDNDFTSIGKNKYSITMNAGDTEWVDFDGIYQDVVFTSTKSEIAYISNNTENLVARKPGKAKITAKVNGKPITIMVTVK
ncbi:MAG: Ig-like domain-containing protein [Lachnospiraceae bacterium]|nr:Ig-like domain-containing protein [Lachnospiraceae bacterium]